MILSSARPRPTVSWRAYVPDGRSRASHWTSGSVRGLRSARMVSVRSSTDTSIVPGSTPGRSIVST
ncbi:Uncharacterised protein [Mycobacteroides abscessus]|nr:Uncharacterised protein [Mycobacteroides abscessus]